MSLRKIDWIVGCAVVVAGLACGGGGSNNGAPVAQITQPATDVTITAGQKLTFQATCVDPDGDAVFSKWTFPSGTPGTSAVFAGLVAWATPGTYAVTYSCVDSSNHASATVKRTVTVTDAGPPSGLQAYSVTPQAGHAGQGISDPPAVKVVDGNGTGVVGIQVTFTVTAGGGGLGDSKSVTANATSGIDGVASVSSWTLGTTGAQEVTASASGLAPVKLAATVDGSASKYHIQLVFLSAPSDSVRQAFTSAAERIGRVVTSQLTSMHVTASAAQMSGCGDTAVDLQVDDLVILADVVPIDGPNGILGQAGPCFVRPSGSKLPVLGLMQFDSADLDSMSSQQLDAVILHEMLHVVGFGTLWGPTDADKLTGAGTSDPRFTGTNATSALVNFNGGSGYTYVPVENTGGAGTRDSHWRESIFKNELMTGYLNPAPATAPMSRTTIASLQDVGYTVDVSQADPFNINSAALLAPGAAEAEPIHLGNDTLPIAPRPVPGY